MGVVINTISHLAYTMFSPGDMWADLDQHKGDENIADKVTTSYYIPLMAILSAALLIRVGYAGGGWLSFDFGGGIKAVTQFCVVFFLLPIIVGFVFKEVCQHWVVMPQKHLKDRLQIYVLYCYSYLMFVATLQQMLPGIKFVGLLTLYVVVIALNGVERYLKVEDNSVLTVTIPSSIIMGYSSIVLNLFK